MIKAIVLFFTTLAVGALCMGVRPTTEPYSHTLTLDRDGNYVLYWKYNASHVTFEVHVRTRGYVGFGLSPSGKMYPSDVVVGWVSNGKAHLKDYHTTGHYAPQADASQDWYLLEGSETEMGTMLKFTRKIDTCDHDDIAINNGTQRLIFSYHTDDPSETGSLMYHGTERRGTKSISLLNQQLPPPIYNKEGDMKVIEIRPNNYVIPDGDTTYLCVGFQMPDLGSKHHMVMFEPIYTPGNELMLHHFVLSRCSGDFRHLNGLTTECYWTWPKDWPQCEDVVLAWATGGGPYYFPENAGYSIGGQNEPMFFVLQTHYDNPGHKSGIIDNSGVRMRLTSSLRQHDVSSFVIGQTVSPFHVVPPKTKSFITKGYCDGKLLGKHMRENNVSEIKVIAALQHAHLLGYGITTRHYRNGTELKPIMDDPNYDFYFQEIRNIPEVTVKAGDDLRVDCNYNSMGRSFTTFGGLSTREEMCESIMYIYPALDVHACTSFTDWSKIYHDIDYKNYTDAMAKVKDHVTKDFDFNDPDSKRNFTETIQNTPFIHMIYGHSKINGTRIYESSIYAEDESDSVPYTYADNCITT